MSYSREARRVLKTLGMLAHSQLGYDGRKALDAASSGVLKTLINANDVQRPFDANGAKEGK